MSIFSRQNKILQKIYMLVKLVIRYKMEMISKIEVMENNIKAVQSNQKKSLFFKGDDFNAIR